MPTERERLKQMAPSALDRARSLDAGYAPQPEAPFSARAYTTAFDAFGGNNPERRQQAIRAANLLTGEGARTALDFVPFIGDALALSDAIKMAEQGNMLGAAGLGTLAAIGLVPGAGDVVAKAGNSKTVKRIFHGTSPESAKSILDKGFDVSKSADGTIWLIDNPNIGEVAATGKGAIIPVDIDESMLKLGGWAETDKYSVNELLQMGYDGLKLKDVDGITYQIFNPEKLKIVK
jgi:hypothetical protein